MTSEEAKVAVHEQRLNRHDDDIDDIKDTLKAVAGGVQRIEVALATHSGTQAGTQAAQKDGTARFWAGLGFLAAAVGGIAQILSLKH